MRRLYIALYDNNEREGVWMVDASSERWMFMAIITFLVGEDVAHEFLEGLNMKAKRAREEAPAS